MTGWKGLIAALGGLLTLLGQYISSMGSWYFVEIGAVLAILFGIWASISK